MKQFLEDNGALKKANEIAYQTSIDSNIGRTHALTIDLDFEHGRAREHMIFTRSDSGKMQLWKLDIDPIN